jgi:hypothetical protein
MPLLVQRTFSASNTALRQTDPAVEKDSPVKTIAKEAPVKTKSVSFSSNVYVQEVPHLVEMTDEDLALVWYSKEECNDMKETVVALTRSMIEDRVEKGECTRGVEHKTPDASRQRKLNRRNALLIVCNAQASQWADGRADGEAIAILYQMETFKSREQARTWGIHDEKSVKSGKPPKKGFFSKLRR